MKIPDSKMPTNNWFCYWLSLCSTKPTDRAHCGRGCDVIKHLPNMSYIEEKQIPIAFVTQKNENNDTYIVDNNRLIDNHIIRFHDYNVKPIGELKTNLEIDKWNEKGRAMMFAVCADSHNWMYVCLVYGDQCSAIHTQHTYLHRNGERMRIGCITEWHFVFGWHTKLLPALHIFELSTWACCNCHCFSKPA